MIRQLHLHTRLILFGLIIHNQKHIAVHWLWLGNSFQSNADQIEHTC